MYNVIDMGYYGICHCIYYTCVSILTFLCYMHDPIDNEFNKILKVYEQKWLPLPIY